MNELYYLSPQTGGIIVQYLNSLWNTSLPSASRSQGIGSPWHTIADETSVLCYSPN